MARPLFIGEKGAGRQKRGTKTGKWTYRFDMDFAVSCQGNDDDVRACEDSGSVSHRHTLYTSLKLKETPSSCINY